MRRSPVLAGLAPIRAPVSAVAALAALALATAMALAATPARAQEVAAAVAPDTTTVGGVFRAAVRVTLPPGVSAGFPDSVATSGEVENAGRRELLTDTVSGRERVTAVYPLTAWRPGDQALPAIAVRLTGAGVDSTFSVALPHVRVASVLPADTSNVQPKPAKGVVGGYGLPWDWILGALVALLLIALLVWWLIRRRRRRPQVPVRVPPLTARQRALAALDAIEAEHVLEREGAVAFYARASAVLRDYLHTLHPPFGPEYTTRELARMIRQSMSQEDARDLIRLLEASDMVKFAKRRPPAAEAGEERAAMRDWIERYPPAPAAAETSEAA